ncbi:unnamed protein product, partial [Mesorhabditis spiculigera]
MSNLNIWAIFFVLFAVCYSQSDSQFTARLRSEREVPQRMSLGRLLGVDQDGDLLFVVPKRVPRQTDFVPCRWKLCTNFLDSYRQQQLLRR